MSNNTKPKAKELLWVAHCARKRLTVVRFTVSGAVYGNPDGPAETGCAYYVNGNGTNAGCFWSASISPERAREMALGWVAEHHPKARLTVTLNKIDGAA